MNDILCNLDECVDTLIKDIDNGNNDCRAMRIDDCKMLTLEKELNVDACSCYHSCGSNFSRNGKCSCYTSCGSNYSH